MRAPALMLLVLMLASPVTASRVSASPLRERVERLGAEWATAGLAEAALPADPAIPADPIDAGDLADTGGADGTPASPADRLVDSLDEAFDAAIADEGIAGDALARAHLAASAVLLDAGRPDAALAHLRDADLWATDAALRARARFNYAQTRYRQAAGAMAPTPERPGPDVDAAKALLRDAAGAFRAVLDVDPADAEAARHTERVRRMIHALDEMQQQAQDRADELREQADELDELADRQQQESMQNDQESQSPETGSRDQSELTDETREQADRNAESNPGSSAQRSLEEAMREQAGAQRDLERGEQGDASEAQRRAAERLREAAEALRRQADEQDGGEPQPQPGEEGGEQEGEPQPGEPGEEEGESQSDRISEWLLDREQRQREQRDRQLRAIRGRPTPVERDW